MVRQIIEIDENKCNGCGACESACHEGAIKIINGKATLTRDDYCDGLGDCLPSCPTDAIKFVNREALAYDEKAVIENQLKAKSSYITQDVPSTLMNWPVQIKLMPVTATYFNGEDLLISADCVAYAYKDFHKKFAHDKAVVIGCPKLDNVDYTLKLQHIFEHNHIKSITLVKMSVPCCTKLEVSVQNALMQSGKIIPLEVFTIDTKGNII